MQPRCRPFPLFAGGFAAMTAAGCAIGRPDPLTTGLLALSAAAATTAAALSVARAPSPRSPARWAPLFGALAGLLVLAAHRLADPMMLGGDASDRGFDRRGVLRGRVASAARLHPRGWTFDVSPATLDGRGPPEGTGRIRLFVPGTPCEAEGNSPALPRPLPGDRIRAFVDIEGYPRGAFPDGADPKTSAKRRGLSARALVEDDLRLRPPETRSTPWVRRAVGRARTALACRLRSGLDGAELGYALAWLTGNRRFLPEQQTTAFRRTGTAHLLAISGLHMGTIGAILWWCIAAVLDVFPRLYRRFRRGPVVAAATVTLLGLYVLFVGAPVSAIRAWAMVAAAAGGLASRRPVSPFHLLAAAAVAILALRPRAIASMGFQLSFAATGAILLFVRYGLSGGSTGPDPTTAIGRLRRWTRRAGLAAGASLSATLSTWPILAGHTGYLPLHGLWLNIAVTPAVSLLLFPAVAGGAIAGLLHPAGLAVVGGAAGAMVRLGVALGDIAAWPGASAVVGLLPVWALATAGAGVALMIVSRLQRRPLLVGGGLLVTALATGPCVRSGGPPEGGYVVHFIPVGQGDATLVEASGGPTVLVDAGGSRLGADPGRTRVVPYLFRQGIGRLDWVIASHGDVDHAGGLSAVARSVDIDAFFHPAGSDSRALDRARRAAVRHGAEAHSIAPGETRGAPGGGPAIRRVPARAAANRNDASLQLRAGPGGSLLLPGDIEREAESWLAGREGVGTEILKVPHHGASTSSTRTFLDATDPTVAVVSAARDSRFDHPSPTVLRRYDQRSIPLAATARHGLVRVVRHPSGRIEVRTHLESKEDSLRTPTS